MGTKSKYTPEFLKKIEYLASLGYPQRKIEEVLGLSQDSLSVSRAKDRIRHGKEGKLVKAFARAREKFIARHLENIDTAAYDKDWRASKYLLSITEPQNFSEKQRLELSNPDGKPVEIRVVKNYGGKRKGKNAEGG